MPEVSICLFISWLLSSEELHFIHGLGLYLEIGLFSTASLSCVLLLSITHRVGGVHNQSGIKEAATDERCRIHQNCWTKQGWG